MTKIPHSPKNALANLVDEGVREKLRLVQECAPAIRHFQELMRVHANALRPLIDATRQNEDLIRQVSESLKLIAPALEAAKNLTMASDTAAAIKAFQVETSALDAAKNLTMATDLAAAMKVASQVDTSALDWAKTLAPHFDVAASIRSSLVGSGVFDQIKALPDFAAPWRGVFDRFDKITNILPPDAFASINNIAESLRLTMPTLPVIDPALFGGAWNDMLAEAIARLRERAEKVANNADASVEDVEALAADAEAVKASAPAEARAGIDEYLSRVFLWLMREVAKDAAKVAVYKAVGTLIIVLTVLAQPESLPTPPLLPPQALVALPLPHAPGAVVVRDGWQIERLPEIIRRAGPKASQRTLKFFTAKVHNPNTRQAYANAVMRFMNWCDARNLELVDITPFAVTAYIEEMEREYAAPATVKQHLAAIRMLFDYLVVGEVLPMNPASSVRGPRHVAKKTPVLQPDEARLLLDSIDVSEAPGLRDRALLAVMVYSFARVSSVVAMNVDDYCRRDAGRWFRLQDNRGQHHEVPVHHKAEEYLDAYVHAANIGNDRNAPLWRTMTNDRKLGTGRMSRVDVFRMIRRRCRQARLDPANCHTLRVTGLTAFLLSGGRIERAQAIAAHKSLWTTKLYDRAANVVTLEDIERIGI